MGYGWLNLASLFLGLGAWALPLIAIFYKRAGEKRGLFIWAGMGACSLSLLAQTFYQRHLVDIGDWSALMDTMGAVTLAATTLVTVALALNLVAALKRK